MPRKVNPEERKAQYEAIKDTARRLMHENGTSGLSMRAIARELGMTAPALYYYFENMDALITALIVDGFNRIADALAQTQEACKDLHPIAQLMEILKTYRQWAITNRSDFQLLYGNPIPGYHAPREVTVPAVIRGFVILTTAIHNVLDTGEVKVLEHMLKLPESTYHMQMQLIANVNETTAEQRDMMASFSVESLTLAIIGWGQIHGLIMLELFEHLQPVVGDTEAYYEQQLRTMFINMGVKPELLD